MDTKAAFDREAFEAWYCNTKGVDKYWIADRRCEPNSYTLGEGVLIYWECWKASREAIEMPSSSDSEYWFEGTFQRMRYERDVEKVITSHGIRIKGAE